MPPRSPTGQQISNTFEGRRIFIQQNSMGKGSGDVERAGSSSSASDEREQLIDRKGSKGALRSTVQQGKVVSVNMHACMYIGA